MFLFLFWSIAVAFFQFDLTVQDLVQDYAVQPLSLQVLVPHQRRFAFPFQTLQTPLDQSFPGDNVELSVGGGATGEEALEEAGAARREGAQGQVEAGHTGARSGQIDSHDWSWGVRRLTNKLTVLSLLFIVLVCVSAKSDLWNFSPPIRGDCCVYVC